MDRSPRSAVDARGDRLAQGVVGVLLFAGYVFGQPWLAPLVAVVAAAGAWRGPQGNALLAGYERLVAPRLPPSPRTLVPAEIVQAQDAFLAGLLALASLAFFAGADGPGWLFVVTAAVVAAVAATTQVHLGEQLIRRLRR